jgi:hypothetical protein
MSKQWKEWHMELNEAIEKPSTADIGEMKELHLNLYKTWKSLQEAKERLELIQNEFDEFKEQLNIDDLPEWCWIWMKKKSRISWKKEFVNRLGQTKANEISAAAKQQKHPQIGIRFIDPKPDDIPIDPETKKRQEKPKRLELSKQKRTPLLKLKMKN